MFQSFDVAGAPQNIDHRLAALRAHLEAQGLDGFLVPRTDEFQNEYIPACAERLHWLTGFSGSWGMAIVLQKRAMLLVDGRYTLQAEQEVNTSTFELRVVPHSSAADWLCEALPDNSRIGFDPWLHTPQQLDKIRAALHAQNSTLVECANPIDALWTDRPAPPMGEVQLHPISLSGQSSQDKQARISAHLTHVNATHLCLTAPDAIAWTLNIRGNDVPHTPLPLSYALLPAYGRPQLFIAPQKITQEVRTALQDSIDILPIEHFVPALKSISAQKASILADPSTTAIAITNLIEQAGGRVLAQENPVEKLKACKNDAELRGARQAHERDAVALCQFLAWFDSADQSQLTEIDMVEKLEDYRRTSGQLRDISFPTIAGSGPNGAIVHYRVTRQSNRALDQNSLFLLDSGAQYQDGTTDITRTLPIGTPTQDMKEHFTWVLQGMIAISRARFPIGTTGAQLDALARLPLWQQGLDFDHGTGHGVGSYLSVHEGPQRLSKHGTVALEAGMILSNEPGFYKTGAYGIRIENLLVVTPPSHIANGERPMLGFETLTLVPIDRRLIVTALLNADEKAWLNAYFARILAQISPLCDEPTQHWLKTACAPL